MALQKFTKKYPLLSQELCLVVEKNKRQIEQIDNEIKKYEILKQTIMRQNSTYVAMSGYLESGLSFPDGKKSDEVPKEGSEIQHWL